VSAIETLRDALFGNPPSPTTEPSREGTLAAFTELYNQVVVGLAAAAQGIATVANTAARDTFYANPDNQSKLVYVNNNNGSATDPANGVYEYVSGAARLAQGFYAGLLAVVEPYAEAAAESAASADEAADRAEAAISSLGDWKVEYLGRPSGTALVSGNAASNQGINFRDPAPHPGRIDDLDLIHVVAGTGSLTIYRLFSGVIYNIVDTATFSTTTSGLTVTTALSKSLNYLAGDIFRLRGDATGVIRTAAGAPDGGGYYVDSSGAPPASITMGAAATGFIVQARLNLKYFDQTVNKTSFAAIQTQAAAGAAAGAATDLLKETSEVTLGRPAGVALTDGTNINTAQVAFLDSFSQDQTFNAIDMFDKVADVLQVVTARNISGTWVRIGNTTVTTIGAAASRRALLASPIEVLAGDRWAIRARTAGAYTYTSGVDGAGVSIGTAADFGTTITFGSASTIRPQLRAVGVAKTQTVTASSFAALKASVNAGTAPIAIAQADYAARYTDGTGWNGLVVYGQSNSTGWNAIPPISSAQPYANLTFGSGVRSAKPGNTAGATQLTSPGTTTTKALIEEQTVSSSGFSSNASNAGESMCSGATSTACDAAFVENQISPGNFVWFASAPGKEGTAIAALAKGSAWYNNFIDHVTEAYARAIAAGKGYKVPAVAWHQGESDAISGTSYATYLAALNTLASNIDADIRSITGQAEPVHFLIFQVAGSNGAATLTSVADIRRAQFDCVDQASRLIHFVAPCYHLTGASDRIHYSNVSQRRNGIALGRALKQLVIDRQKPDCLWPISAYARGTELRVKFRGQQLPLVIDPTSLGTVNDNGWKVSDGTGTLTLSNIRVSSAGDEVVMTLNRALGASPIVRHALDYVSTIASLTLCAGGNLRSSNSKTRNINGTAYPLWHVAPSFQKNITILEA